MDENNKYGLKKIHEELLIMLREINDILKENNIVYSLNGGSLLGAIRDNGFIPWDDDIDIMVDRTNYEKIVNLFSKQESINGYKLIRDLWLYRLKKVNSVDDEFSPTIDIFVMDNCPDDLLIRKFKIFAIKFLQGMMHKNKSNKKIGVFYSICMFLTRSFGKLFTYNFKFNLYDKIAKIGNQKETKYIAGYTDSFNSLSLMYNSVLLKKIEYHCFENLLIPITSDYDNYLTTYYGDYMTPPKEEDRKPIHMTGDCIK